MEVGLIINEKKTKYLKSTKKGNESLNIKPYPANVENRVSS